MEEAWRTVCIGCGRFFGYREAGPKKDARRKAVEARGEPEMDLWAVNVTYTEQE